MSLQAHREIFIEKLSFVASFKRMSIAFFYCRAFVSFLSFSLPSLSADGEKNVVVLWGDEKG